MTNQYKYSNDKISVPMLYVFGKMKYMIAVVIMISILLGQDTSPYDSLKLARKMVVKKNYGRSYKLFEWYFFNRNRNHETFKDRYNEAGIRLSLDYWKKLEKENSEIRNKLVIIRDSLRVRLLENEYDDFLCRDIVFISNYLKDYQSNVDLLLSLERMNLSRDKLYKCYKHINTSLKYLSRLDIINRYAEPIKPGNYDPQELKVYNKAIEVLESLKNEDWTHFSKLISPEGIRFVSTMCPRNDNQIFTPEEVMQFGKNKTKYNWGPFGESDDDIILTPVQYIKSYVNAWTTLIYGQPIMNPGVPRGYSWNCTNSFYPSHHLYYHMKFYVEVSEFSDYFGWYSVWLVFKEENDDLLLKAILFNTWGV